MAQHPPAVQWNCDADGFLRLIDQTRLPGEVVFRDCYTTEDVWQAIKELAVRGAPAIGVAAAYAIVLAARHNRQTQTELFLERLRERASYLKSCRPTAVNLAWAVDQMLQSVESCRDGTDPATMLNMLLAKAHAIRDEDAGMCRAIGEHGARLLPSSGGVLTHCNAGALATSEHGTALATMFAAWRQGKRFRVFADETRPLLQGARLTCWELQQHGIDATLICDNMAGLLMKQGRIQAVMVGADRIAANGDAANKIGTYSVAVLARHHGIPFYVAAPSSTFDLSLPNGDHIPIEVRDPSEITAPFGRVTAPAGIDVYNPAFDVTPGSLISAIVTERGIIQPVSVQQIQDEIGV